MKKIEDEFTGLKVSRQRLHQLRKQKKGICSTCTEPIYLGKLCKKHYEQKLEKRKNARKQMEGKTE